VIVIDASSLAKYVLKEDGWVEIEKINAIWKCKIALGSFPST